MRSCADRRPTLIEGVVVFAIAWWGSWVPWHIAFVVAPHLHYGMEGPWVQHLWFAIVPLLWCLIFGRRIPLGGLTQNLRAWLVPGVVTFGISIGALFVLYLTPVRHMLVHVFPHDAQSLIFSTVAPGLGEEMLFRGFLQTSFNRTLPWMIRLGRLQFGTGTLLAAIVFGLAHLGNGTPLPVLISVGFFAGLIGLGLGIGYERSGNIWVAMILHNAMNLVNAGLLLFLPGTA